MRKKLFLCVALALLCAQTVFADKIADYEFEKGKSGLIVGNRAAEKCIALTFDDGPHPEYTRQILEILDRYDAKATFFVIGENAAEYPELVREEAVRGHQIGNHTYTHPELKKLSEAAFTEELRRTQTTIEEITGTAPVLFRPPGGYLNNMIVRTAASEGCTPVLWSWRQDTRDWSCPTVDCIVEKVLKNLQDGDIILFHDYNARTSPTPQALERILKTLSEKNYRFVTVSELAEQ